MPLIAPPQPARPTATPRTPDMPSDPLASVSDPERGRLRDQYRGFWLPRFRTADLAHQQMRQQRAYTERSQRDLTDYLIHQPQVSERMRKTLNRDLERYRQELHDLDLLIEHGHRL